jgi:hypothetical protein
MWAENGEGHIYYSYSNYRVDITVNHEAGSQYGDRGNPHGGTRFLYTKAQRNIISFGNRT